MTVYHSNWVAFELFRSCATQWKISPMGGKTGLDYTAVKAVADWLKIKTTPALFGRIRLLEVGAIAAANDRKLSELIDDG